MINIKDLWTGDFIRQISTGSIGVYEGVSGSLLKIKLRSSIILVNPKDAELISEAEVDKIRAQEIYRTDRKVINSTKRIPKQIDLHLEKLDPEGRITSHARMLDFQLNACKSYLEQAHQYGHRVVTVIHGIGIGILKREVRFMIDGLSYVQFSNPINDDGATEVWFK